jgi:soluble lytic murein transglycosylase-like protein
MEEHRGDRTWPPSIPPAIFLLLLLCGVAGVSALLVGLTRSGRMQNDLANIDSELSPIFTPEIHYWAAEIVRWSDENGLDPDLVATVMQIESCGHPAISSPAGAQGLFQVMPFHFSPGEDPLNPDTNAARGLSYMATLLEQTNGNTGLAFAGYNGGPGAAASGPSGWVSETADYFYWSTGIYADALTGQQESTRLQEWLNAGGRLLCLQAAAHLNLSERQQ